VLLHSLGDAFITITEIDVCTAIVFVWFERLRPSLGEQRHWRGGVLVDLAYTYVGGLVGLLTAMVGLGRAMDALGPAMHDTLGRLQGAVSGLPLAVQLVIAVVISDFFGYWKHRALHTRFLWPFHAVHHSSEEVDWLSNERMHPVEMVVTSFFFVIPLVALGLPPAAIAWTAQIRRFHSVYEHGNLNIDYGRGHYVLVSPIFHRWHHSSDAASVDTNYANIFSFFDWLFGTFKLPRDAPPAGGFGVPGFPKDFWRQLLHPFRDAVVGQRLRS
jgi:sterol desaturase/sphingolipid hydroxylase (fatty acid hydroxylase superfamily)